MSIELSLLEDWTQTVQSWPNATTKL